MADLKHIGTSGNGRMSIDDLLLNIKAVSFESLVRQTDIQTEEDKKFYAEKGYSFLLTEAEFREKYTLDPSCIWYTPSFSQGCLYFNEDTLAVAPFHIELLSSGLYTDVSSVYKAIQCREEEVAVHQYMGSIITLPDAMRLQYFERLLEKKGPDVPGLYELFCSTYVDSDYGFGNLSRAVLEQIFASKTDLDREKTAMALSALPDKVKIYRGGNSATTPYDKAFSWSLDINVANFFACRRGIDDGHIVEAVVNKADIIEAFLDDRGEAEVLVDPEKLQDVQEMRVRGVSFLKQALMDVAPMY